MNTSQLSQIKKRHLNVIQQLSLNIKCIQK